MSNEEDKTIYKVVVNDEGQYAVWPVNQRNATGWKDVLGKRGTKDQCLSYIEELILNKYN